MESHVFPRQTVPQIVIIDTYKGAAQANVRIENAATINQSELLRNDNVVAVNPGHYRLGLKNTQTSAAPLQSPWSWRWETRVTLLSIVAPRQIKV